MLIAVDSYRLLLSPWIGQSCRFEPSCSRYTRDAIDTHGAAVGAYLGARRLLRCHPWCEAGHDPVPSRAQWRHAFEAAQRRLRSRLTDSR
jgi:uncharacterized protein